MKTFDPPRIEKLAGTLSMKGGNTFERPRRYCSIQEYFISSASQLFVDLLEVFPELLIQNENKISELSKENKIINQKNISYKSSKNKSVKNIKCGCKAFNEICNKNLESLRYSEMSAWLSLARHTDDGENDLRDNFPGDITESQIIAAKKRNFLPYTCKKLQEIGVCIIGIHPTFGNKCLKNYLNSENIEIEASPIRFATGVSNSKIKGGKK